MKRLTRIRRVNYDGRLKPPSTLMKTRITYRLLRLLVLRSGYATKSESRLFRRSCVEGPIELRPAGERGTRRALALHEGGEFGVTEYKRIVKKNVLTLRPSLY